MWSKPYSFVTCPKLACQVKSSAKLFRRSAKWWRACISFERCRFDSHLVQSEALVGNDRRHRETWVGSLSQTGFTRNFTVVPTDGWVTGFSPELVVDSGYSRSILFIQWVPRECSGLSLLAVQKKVLLYLYPLKTTSYGKFAMTL
ncbi:hypothetical protein Hanom_Chr14g01271521 [Helianthus anomalus]